MTAVWRQLRAQALAESVALRDGLYRRPVPPAELVYRLIVTCPRCGGPAKHITGSTPKPIGTDARALVACAAGCDPRDSWLIAAEIRCERSARKAEASYNATVAAAQRARVSQ